MELVTVLRQEVRGHGVKIKECSLGCVMWSSQVFLVRAFGG